MIFRDRVCVRAAGVGHAARLMAILFTIGSTSAAAGAQSAPRERAPGSAVAGRPIRGPEPPRLPESVSRSPAGDATVRAVRLRVPLTIDGALHEPLYTEVRPANRFVQIEPVEGQPTTQDTEVWVSYDEDNVYVSVRCWESDLDRMVANDMRRDSAGLENGDHVAFMFDTYYDARNAIVFFANAIGGRSDGQVTNDRQYNKDWNPVWNVRVGRFAGGWTVEAALPFKSFRFQPGRAQVWGFNVRRSNRWKNEVSFLKRMPNDLGPRGLYQASLAATLVGIEAPAGARNLDLKPFATGSLTTGRETPSSLASTVDGSGGLDAKYVISQNVTADLTINTDFAQVEADDEQVNLTRFSLFFPEKREFFLENQGLFVFGGAGSTGGGDTPILFYSRRIGLDGGRGVPVLGGGRVTGRLGAFDVGVLNIWTDEDKATASPATSFSVVRVKRDILRRSSIGVLATDRSHASSGPGASRSYGVDGQLAFYDNLRINTYWARTDAEGVRSDNTSYRAELNYSGDRYGLSAEHLLVGKQFSPGIGFVRRPDMRRSAASARFSPRPKANRVVRKVGWNSAIDYIEDTEGRLVSREFEAEFTTDFQNGDRFFYSYGNQYELLVAPFAIARSVTLAPGGYNFASSWFSYSFGTQRRLAGMLFLDKGSFYDGDRTSLGFSGARAEVTPQLSVEPGLSFNWIDLPAGRFTTQLITTRTTYTVTPRMFVSALVQYNSSNRALGTNLRLRWEYQPGSELFIVVNEQRDTNRPGFPDLQNRSVVVKINRLFRF